ncbi:unnamed protein product, partial [Allacma fusca]
SLLPPNISFYHELDTARPPNLKNPTVHILRYVPHCFQAIIFLDTAQDPGKIYHSEPKYQVRSTLPFPFNTHPQLVNHIFICPSETIALGILKVDSFLKYKTGIVFDPMNNNHLILSESCFGNGEFRADLLTRKCSKHDILRKRHFRTVAFPDKLHVNRDVDGKPIGGLSYSFISSISSFYNSTFDFEHKAYSNLRQNPDGSWNGFIGVLANG